jgi:hypothetical protein
VFLASLVEPREFEDEPEVELTELLTFALGPFPVAILGKKLARVQVDRRFTNLLAKTPPSLVARRRCSSPGPSQGVHITSRSTLDLHELGLCTCAYSVGRVGENHRTQRRAAPLGYLRAAELEMRAAEEPLRPDLNVKGLKPQVFGRIEELEAREDLLSEILYERRREGTTREW